MPTDKDELNEYLKKTVEQQSLVIDTLNKTIEGLEITIVNLNETIDELKRKLFGTSSEKIKKKELEEESVICGEIGRAHV